MFNMILPREGEVDDISVNLSPNNLYHIKYMFVTQHILACLYFISFILIYNYAMKIDTLVHVQLMTPDITYLQQVIPIA